MENLTWMQPTNNVSRPVTTNQENVKGSERQNYLAYRRALRIWLRPGVALARGQSNRGSHPVEDRGGFELEARAS